MIHLASKVPNFIRFLFSKALDVQEEAWNAYPYCRTVITNPGYMKDNAYIKIETLHAQDAGTNENAHNLPKNLLDKRKVRLIRCMIWEDGSLIHRVRIYVDKCWIFIYFGFSSWVLPVFLDAFSHLYKRVWPSVRR